MRLLRHRLPPIAVAALGLACGCAVERHWVQNPGVSQAIRVESGDRRYFDLEEDYASGYRWRCVCDDPDVDVTVSHKPTAASSANSASSGVAKVEIRVHRGYDGPSTLVFSCRRSRDSEPVRQFTLTLFKRTGDCAFWE